MLVWPLVAAVGFVLLAAVVIALATSSTAQYEFERNRVQGQRQEAPVPVAAGAVAGPLGSTAAEVRTGGATREVGAEQASAVSLAAHPAGSRLVDRDATAAWWLLDATGDRVVAGPFRDRIEADWAALAGETGTATSVGYGMPRADGGLVRRQSPQEQAWLSDLGDQLDRLAEDWDERLTDDDALVTLVVEVAAALVEAGLTVHDCAGHGPAGGVCLTPEPGRGGVLVSWHQHDRMSRDQVRGAATDAAVQQTMNTALADCLHQMGFEVEAFGSSGCSLVTSAQSWWS